MSILSKTPLRSACFTALQLLLLASKMEAMPPMFSEGSPEGEIRGESPGSSTAQRTEQNRRLHLDDKQDQREENVTALTEDERDIFESLKDPNFVSRETKSFKDNFDSLKQNLLSEQDLEQLLSKSQLYREKGDEVLKDLEQQNQVHKEKGDLIAQQQGEEFIASLKELIETADNILEHEKLKTVDPRLLSTLCNPSFGIEIINKHYKTADELFAQADKKWEERQRYLQYNQNAKEEMQKFYEWDREQEESRKNAESGVLETGLNVGSSVINTIAQSGSMPLALTGLILQGISNLPRYFK